MECGDSSLHSIALRGSVDLFLLMKTRIEYRPP